MQTFLDYTLGWFVDTTPARPKIVDQTMLVEKISSLKHVEAPMVYPPIWTESDRHLKNIQTGVALKPLVTGPIKKYRYVQPHISYADCAKFGHAYGLSASARPLV